MPQFNQLAAAQSLRALAINPYDLTQEGNLSPKRIKGFQVEGGGYKLLFGTERVTQDVMNQLYQLANQTDAIEKMRQMQEGEVINRIEGYASENRAVLHTATRDFFDSPQTTQAAASAARLAKAEVDKIKSFIKNLDKDNQYTDLVLIGIGGSYLGPRATYLALERWKKPGKNVHFISNVDPDDTSRALLQVNLKKALVMVVSKTGTTLETLTNESFVRERFKKAGLKPEEHFISVTGQGSPMDNKERYLECFYMWDWVGGRFSTSSAIGGVLISFACGFEIFWEFLRGAHEMDKVALTKKPAENLPLVAALLAVWNRNFLKYPTLAIIPYSQALSRFVAHIQQVEMESNGKHIDKQGNRVDYETGAIMWGEPGTDAQHSFYQCIHQGTSIIPVEFIGFKKSQYEQDSELKGTTSQQKLIANLLAQSIALATGQKNENPNKNFEGNRPNHILLADQLNPQSVGALLSFYEHKVAFEGFIWNINSFDQEGVQLGKVLASKIMSGMESKNGSYPLGDVLIEEFQ